MDTMFEGKQKEEIFNYVFWFMLKWKLHFILDRILLFRMKRTFCFEYYSSCMWPDRPQYMDLWVIEKIFVAL